MWFISKIVGMIKYNKMKNDERTKKEEEKKKRDLENYKIMIENFHKGMKELRKEKELTLNEMNKIDNSFTLNERNEFVLKKNIKDNIKNMR